MSNVIADGSNVQLITVAPKNIFETSTNIEPGSSDTSDEGKIDVVTEVENNEIIKIHADKSDVINVEDVAPVPIAAANVIDNDNPENLNINPEGMSKCQYLYSIRDFRVGLLYLILFIIATGLFIFLPIYAHNTANVNPYNYSECKIINNTITNCLSNQDCFIVNTYVYLQNITSLYYTNCDLDMNCVVNTIHTFIPNSDHYCFYDYIEFIVVIDKDISNPYDSAAIFTFVVAGVFGLAVLFLMVHLIKITIKVCCV
jgi:hypothetical protein